MNQPHKDNQPQSVGVEERLTLAQELRAAISGVILGSIELKFAHFIDHDDYLRQHYAEEHLTTLLTHLDNKLTELTDLVAADSEPPKNPATIDIEGMLKVMLLTAIKHAKDGGSSSLQTLQMYCSSDDYAYYKTQIQLLLADLITEKENRARVDELEGVANNALPWFDGGVPTKERVEKMWHTYISNRLATLKSKGRDNE